MNDQGGHIHLILPNAVERAACFRILAAEPQRVVRSFSSGEAWVEAAADRDCAILLFHWRQPGRVSGDLILRRVDGRKDITAFVAADRLTIDESRTILRGGARDLLPAPLDPRLVRHTIETAIADWNERQLTLARRREAETRLAALTPRERDILDAIAAGLGNKAIARRLDLSPRTVEVHRANIMRRTDVGSVAELLRLAFTVEMSRGHLLRFGA